MSIPFSGALRKSGGVVSAIGKQVKLLNLRAVKRVTVTFDPFHENVTSTRDLLFLLSCPKITATNTNCVIKTEIVCNRQGPTIDFQLIPSVQETSKLKRIKFNGDNLNTLELLQLCNKHVTALAPKEEIVNIVKTKGEKKASAGGKKR